MQFLMLEGVCSSSSYCLFDVDNCAILECVSVQHKGVLVLKIAVIGHGWFFLSSKPKQNPALKTGVMWGCLPTVPGEANPSPTRALLLLMNESGRCDFTSVS